MKLAIIGVGNVGESFARAAVGVGHDVTLAASRPENARRVAGEVGAQPADSVREAAAGADAVVLAVPYREAGDLVRQLDDGTTIIDVTNPVSDGGDDLVARPSAAEELQGAAPGAKVVKAFNTIFASRLGDPTEGGAPLDAFYAGDDDAAKGMVADLARSLGYRPIDAGGLRMARSLEEMALLNISLNARNGWSWQSGWKLAGPTG
jgi:8-hydroxy-5-deazaflavin:NADPH oxidoreductase